MPVRSISLGVHAVWVGGNLFTTLLLVYGFIKLPQYKGFLVMAVAEALYTFIAILSLGMSWRIKLLRPILGTEGFRIFYKCFLLAQPVVLLISIIGMLMLIFKMIRVHAGSEYESG